VELALLAVVLAGVVLVLTREFVLQSRRFGPLLRRFRFVPPLLAILVLVGFCVAGDLFSAVAEDQPLRAAKGRPEGRPAVKKLVRPAGWPPNHPLPLVGSNCAACHLTAGRELTAAVVNFARSTHDLQEMTCYDCHGGNTVDDVKAHVEAFGFIGTKKSAHIATCSECHSEAAEALASGPHHWDFSARINTEYPLCFDCHGNHDIGNVPADFKLEAMCGDCHEDMDEAFPNLLVVVQQNDRLWGTMGQVRRRRVGEPNPLPEEFHDDVTALRGETMTLVHTSKEISAEQAKELNRRVETLRGQLEKWLQAHPEMNGS
jgi:hypothetical protein